MSKASLSVQYLRKGDNFEFSGQASLEKKLPAGVYSIKQDDMGNLFLKAEEIQTEILIDIPDSPMYSIMNKIDNFLTNDIKEAFKKYGMIYKRGILLYGPPGTGKTSVVNQVINIATQKKDMVVLLCPYAGWVKSVVEKVREIEQKDRPFMVVWEEFENVATHQESYVLSLLDGISQVGNIIYLATTNYIDSIPARIINRPSRFADVFEIGLPSANVRKLFLQSKLCKGDKIDVNLWVNQTEGFSIDHLKDLIINVFVLQMPFEHAIERMRKVGEDDKESDEKSNDDYDDEHDDCKVNTATPSILKRCR